MTRNVFVALTVLAVSVAAAQMWQPDRPRALDYLGESGGSLVSGALMGIGAGAAVYLFDFIGGLNADVGGILIQITSPFIGAVLAYPAGCAWGATSIGHGPNVDGNTGLSYGGAFIGLGLGVIAGLATHRSAVGLIGIGALAPAGAVIGYNIGATEAEAPSALGARFSSPAVAFRIRLGPDRQAQTVVNCRVVTMRF